MNKPSVQLIVFDYDGTITAEDGTHVSPCVTAGIQELWGKGVATTAITARPYRRLEQLSGGCREFVSDHMSIATDRGARIVDSARLANLEYHSLPHADLQFILQLPHAAIDFIGFYPEELHGSSYIWAPRPERATQLRKAFDDVTLLTKPHELAHAITDANPCLITIRFASPDASNHALFPEHMNTEWTGQTVSVVAPGIDKWSALSSICDDSDITPESTVFAGNDYNDLSVLAQDHLLDRLFVGPIMVAGTESCTRIATSDDLGRYFSKLAKECGDVR